MELYVQCTKECTFSEREPGPHGSWRKEYRFLVNSVSETAVPREWPYSEETFTVDFEAKAGEAVFVLWMTYSSGDSFGHASGLGEVLWVFKDAAVARAARDAWVVDSDDYLVSFTTEGGHVIKLSNPAYGYFENIASVELSAFLINP